MSTRTAPKPVLDKYSLQTSRQLVAIMERIAALYPSCDEREWKQALSTELEAETVGLPDYIAELFRCALPGIASYIVNRYMASLVKAGGATFPTPEPKTIDIPQQPGTPLPPRPVQLALPILERIDALIAAITDIRAQQRTKLDELHTEQQRITVLVQEQRDELRRSDEAERHLPLLRELSLAHPTAESIEDLVEIARVTVPDFAIDKGTVQWMRERLAA
ncbi:hypothetical protein ACIQI7_32600 [Kitasatospora sp. NPDC092039]|uniref:hypothetical protein n=1 Tax=Kitasatospora sp. NPDC092039 TaxID=3364086 RepID=UPI003818B518